MEPKISFVIPLFNEEEVFQKLVGRMNQLMSTIDETCEVVLIDEKFRASKSAHCWLRLYKR